MAFKALEPDGGTLAKTVFHVQHRQLALRKTHPYTFQLAVALAGRGPYPAHALGIRLVGQFEYFCQFGQAG